MQYSYLGDSTPQTKRPLLLAVLGVASIACLFLLSTSTIDGSSLQQVLTIPSSTRTIIIDQTPKTNLALGKFAW